MSNMDYCRFINTLEDLSDCYEHMEEELSPMEQKAKLELIELACSIALEYGREVGRRVEEV